MSYQVLARKWRPRLFTDMVGQGHVLRVLVNALDSDRLHHAYLFTGTRGVGKTTLARILAKCLNCEAGVSSSPCGECSACTGIDEGRFVDLIEVDAASRAKVDETRELMDNVQYSPTIGRYKIYLIDEVHMFSKHSFNALLKTLEEPPPHVKFLLATTEPKRIPITILSRCLQFNLKHLTSEQIESQLRSILTEEKITAEDVSIHLLAAAADGSMRDALSLLDQAISYGNGQLQEDQVRDMLGTIDAADLTGLLEALSERDAGAMFTKINEMAELAPDYDAVLSELLSMLHDIAVAHALPDGSDLVGETARAFVGRLEKEDVQLYYQVALNGRKDLYMAPDPKTGFEMTMIRMLAFRPWEPGAAPKPGSGRPAAQNSGAVTGKDSSGTGNNEPAAADTESKAENLSPATENGEPATQNNERAIESNGPATENDRSKDEPVTVQNGVRDRPVLPLMGNDGWHNLVGGMTLDGLTKELAGHCVLKEHGEHRLYLTLQPDQGHLLTITRKEKLQDALCTCFGGEIKLVITIEQARDETPAQRKTREDIEARQAAVESIEKDPDVKSIVDTFDATIDKESTRPSSRPGFLTR